MAAAPVALPDRFARVRDHIRASERRYVEALREFVRIPSVTMDVPACREAARFLGDIVSNAGFAVRADPIAGAGPMLFARVPDAPRSPSVIGYAHYDVKPAGDRAAWTRDPWGGEIDGGRLFGRGAADDKSGCLAFVFAAEA